VNTNGATAWCYSKEPRNRDPKLPIALHVNQESCRGTLDRYTITSSIWRCGKSISRSKHVLRSPLYRPYSRLCFNESPGPRFTAEILSQVIGNIFLMSRNALRRFGNWRYRTSNGSKMVNIAAQTFYAVRIPQSISRAEGASRCRTTRRHSPKMRDEPTALEPYLQILYKWFEDINGRHPPQALCSIPEINPTTVDKLSIVQMKNIETLDESHAP
jgi:hypothetical protein